MVFFICFALLFVSIRCFIQDNAIHAEKQVGVC